MNDIESAVVVAPETARKLKIADADGYKVAADFLIDVKTLRKKVDDFCDPNISRLHSAHKAAIRDKRRLTDPLDEAERIIKTEIGRYTAEEEARQREAAAKAEAELRDREEERRLAEAEALDREGKHAEAMHLIDEPISSPAVIPAPAAPKVGGLSTSENWTFIVEDEASVPREFCTPDPVKIRAKVKALKGATAIPGVRVYAEKVVRAASRMV